MMTTIHIQSSKIPGNQHVTQVKIVREHAIYEGDDDNGGKKMAFNQRSFVRYL